MHNIIERALGRLTEEEQVQTARSLAVLRDSGFLKSLVHAAKENAVESLPANLTPEGIDLTRQVVLENNCLSTFTRALGQFGVREGERVKVRQPAKEPVDF